MYQHNLRREILLKLRLEDVTNGWCFCVSYSEESQTRRCFVDIDCALEQATGKFMGHQERLHWVEHTNFLSILIALIYCGEYTNTIKKNIVNKIFENMLQFKYLGTTATARKENQIHFLKRFLSFGSESFSRCLSKYTKDKTTYNFVCSIWVWNLISRSGGYHKFRMFGTRLFRRIFALIKEGI